MQIVIEIPEESYKAACNGCMLPPDVENVVQGIKNGRPLPEVHGDLIDRSTAHGVFVQEMWGIGCVNQTIRVIDNESYIPTIVPAKEEECDAEDCN